MSLSINDAEDYIRDAFKRAGIDVEDLASRVYPEETVFIVYVPEASFATAAQTGNDLDRDLAQQGVTGFVTVRKSQKKVAHATERVAKGVHDQRATELTRLITARSRTSEVQPSLAYVRDSAANVTAVTAPRHHLIFGRRGVGKTALMVEARRIVTEEGHLSCWINLQTYRREPSGRMFLYISQGLLETLQASMKGAMESSQVAAQIAEIMSDLKLMLAIDDPSDQSVARMVPRIQRVLHRFLASSGLRLYIFIDDFYYVVRERQPELLDMIHGCVRDVDAWLKVASIQYLTRWFQASPPVGLQTGQDADIVNLDITLQDPGRARRFLEDVLGRYASQVGIQSVTAVISRQALDRLVLASGGVPRDYLVLSASAITKAQLREKARLVGVQDVNQAAGDAAQVKVQELEDDLAGNVGSADQTLRALRVVREFCLDRRGSTYYRVSFRDKEAHPDEYGMLTSLTDLRLNHLIDPSLSERHQAGERSEVYMLDLSQFSGARLKQGVRVLDFVGDSIVSRRTGEKGSSRFAATPRQLITVLRSSPALGLSLFSDTLGGQG
jgi:hypothetical protein